MKKKLIKSSIVKIIVAVVCAVVAYMLFLLTRKNKATTNYGIVKGGELTQAQAQYFAEQLHDAMKLPGTDEKAIEEVFNEICGHKLAILQVHEAFGGKRYSVWGKSLIGIKLNLNQWLKEELSSKEYAKWQILYESAVK